MGIWLPEKDDMRRFGLDISYYQGMSDFDKMAAYNNPPVDFIGIRYGISWAYTDKYWSYNWSEAKRVGINRLAYHVVYPKEKPSDQMAHFLKGLTPDAGEGPPVLDVELNHGASRQVITETVMQCVMILYGALGRYPIIYTRPQFVKDYMLWGQDWYEKVPWWMATYTWTGREHNGTGVVEASEQYGIPGEMVWIHQTSSKGNGPTFGVKSADLDYDRWMGTELDYEECFGEETPIPPLPNPDCEIDLIVPQGAKVTVTER